MEDRMVNTLPISEKPSFAGWDTALALGRVILVTGRIRALISMPAIDWDTAEWDRFYAHLTAYLNEDVDFLSLPAGSKLEMQDQVPRRL